MSCQALSAAKSTKSDQLHKSAETLKGVARLQGGNDGIVAQAEMFCLTCFRLKRSDNILTALC